VYSSLPNLLAAFGLLVEDAVAERLEQELGRNATAAAALVMLERQQLSVGELRQALALTHSGAVRLVDRLEDDGFVERARHGRDVTVSLTRRGRTACARLESERLAAAADLASALTSSERKQLEKLLRRILAAQTENDDDLNRICRLCSFEACESAGTACPVAEAVQRAAPRGGTARAAASGCR
jgi:DNA-binding MarR family transcriptional regulator